MGLNTWKDFVKCPRSDDTQCKTIDHLISERINLSPEDRVMNDLHYTSVEYSTYERLIPCINNLRESSIFSQETCLNMTDAVLLKPQEQTRAYVLILS